MDNKKILRKEMLLKRDGLSESFIFDASVSVLNRFTEFIRGKGFNSFLLYADTKKEAIQKLKQLQA